MGDEIKIDKTQFFERLGHLYSSWKADKRQGDSVFGGASSIVILAGRADESGAYAKNNSLHVSPILLRLMPTRVINPLLCMNHVNILLPSSGFLVTSSLKP